VHSLSPDFATKPYGSFALTACASRDTSPIHPLPRFRRGLRRPVRVATRIAASAWPADGQKRIKAVPESLRRACTFGRIRPARQNCNGASSRVSARAAEHRCGHASNDSRSGRAALAWQPPDLVHRARIGTTRPCLCSSTQLTSQCPIPHHPARFGDETPPRVNLPHRRSRTVAALNRARAAVELPAAVVCSPVRRGCAHDAAARSLNPSGTGHIAAAC
jgi:hypothetical protein